MPDLFNSALVSAEHFARQWTDPVAGPELRALGFEEPAQMGTLFMMDAARIKELTKNSLPLVDAYPGRLGNDYIGRKEMRNSYIPYMNIDRSKKEFLSSSLVQRLWPDSIKKETIRFFNFRNYINWSLHPLKQPIRMEDFHKVLTMSSLRAPVLWTMRSRENHQRIVDKVMMQKPSLTEEIHYHLGARSMADRDYSVAEKHFAKVRTSSPRYRDPAFFRIYLLCLSGELEKAEELVQKFKEEHQRQDANFRWLADKFGLGLH